MPAERPTLADALDELARTRPEEFVATRTRLAKALREVGARDDASVLQSQRKPNVVAWSVNQVALSRPDLVAALFTAADEVRAAVTAGDGDTLRSAMRAQRDRAAELTTATIERAAEVTVSPDAHRDAIGATWEAAVGDEHTRTTVASGRLTADLRPGSVPYVGDDSAEGTRGLPAPSGSTRRARGLPRDELAMRRAEDALADARRELADAVDAVAKAEEDLAHATRAAERARTARDRAERRVERAEHVVAERRSR